MCSLSVRLIIGFCPVDMMCVCTTWREKEITRLNEKATSTHYGKELLQLMWGCVFLRVGVCLCLSVGVSVWVWEKI